MKAIGPGSATRRTAVFMGCLALIFSLSMIGCTKKDVPKPTIVFADPGWDSGQVHARVAAFIVKNGMGYDVDFIPGETIPLFQGLARGDIDISMEIWYENQKEAVDKAEAEGKVIDLGDNFPDSWQGWLVPTYVIKGDPARGIEPMAPDLKSVYDLPQYKDVFKDVEDPGKGRFYSCISGWECEKINEKKRIRSRISWPMATPALPGVNGSFISGIHLKELKKNGLLSVGALNRRRCIL